MISRFIPSPREMLPRWWAQLNRFRLIRNYLSGSGPAKLHIGCGPHILPGWLNTDIAPLKGAIYLDATKRFPFKSGTFEFIYCEHMLEHISISSGEAFLSECLRVLKPEGVLRIATPDMACLFVIWTESETHQMREYIANAARHFVGYPRLANKCLTINNFFYNWGHQFIYDEETLVWLLRKTGFAAIQRTKVSESTHASLRGLERHALSIGEEFNSFETMVIEGRRASTP